jgi:exopolysaccharide biosynthesis WecB/TagA/CpsF family protein
MSEIDAAWRSESGAAFAGRFRFPRVIVGGLPVAVLSRADTAKLTLAAALARRGHDEPCLFFTTSNGQVISIAALDRATQRLFENADLISADGMSVVFASRLGPGPALPERVATTDAFHDCARLAADRGARFFFLGATEDVNRAAYARAQELYPNVAFVGRRNGYFGPAEEEAIVSEINDAAPDVLWVGLGVPFQQEFIQRNRGHLTRVGVAKSCGGLFDFLAGKNRRAPRWMQKAGLEWAFRIHEEPRRLAWRYLTTNPHAAFWLLRSRGTASDGAINFGAAA